MERIEIAYSITDRTGDYTTYLGAAIISVLKNTESKVGFHILTDDSMTAERRSGLEQIAARYGAAIDFYRVEFDTSGWSPSFLEHYSKATCWRLLLPELLADRDRVIYLDADTCVNLDIAELWHEDLAGCALGAVRDEDMSGDSHVEPSEQQYPLDYSVYVNAGVLVLDLAKLREHYTLAKTARDFILEYPDVPWADQAALNYVLQRDVKLLPNKYNLYPRYQADIDTVEHRIYHFCSYKPWNLRTSGADRLFWQNLQETPWYADNHDELFRRMFAVQPIPPALEDVIDEYPVHNRRKFLRAVCKKSLNILSLYLRSRVRRS